MCDYGVVVCLFFGLDVLAERLNRLRVRVAGGCVWSSVRLDRQRE